MPRMLALSAISISDALENNPPRTPRVRVDSDLRAVVMEHLLSRPNLPSRSGVASLIFCWKHGVDADARRDFENDATIRRIDHRK